MCLKDKIPTFSETHWSTAPFSESETFRREKKVDLFCAICILCREDVNSDDDDDE